MNNKFGRIKNTVKAKKWYFISILALVLTFSVFQNLIVKTTDLKSGATLADSLAKMIEIQKKLAVVIFFQ